MCQKTMSTVKGWFPHVFRDSRKGPWETATCPPWLLGALCCLWLPGDHFWSIPCKDHSCLCSRPHPREPTPEVSGCIRHVPPVGTTPGNICQAAENTPPPSLIFHLLSRVLPAWEGGQKVSLSQLCKNVHFPSESVLASCCLL